MLITSHLVTPMEDKYYAKKKKYKPTQEGIISRPVTDYSVS